MSNIPDSLSGRANYEIDDNGLGANGVFLRCNGANGLPIAGIDQQGYIWGKGVNGINYGSVTMRLSSAQILTFHSVPVQLVPAQGANTITLVQEFIMHYNYGTAAYVTGSQNIGTYYDSLPATPISLTNCLGFLTATSGQLNNPVIQSNLTIPDANCINQPIWIYTTTSDPTTGDGTLDVLVKYYVLRVGAGLTF